MDLSSILSARQIREIEELCRKHHVKKLFLFGSILTSRFRKSSDVDFLVSFRDLEYGDYAEAYFNLAEGLENVLGRKIDLITEKSLRTAFFIESVESNKKLLYAA